MNTPYPYPHLPPPSKQGLYDPRFEHDACGVGLVADIKGRKSHDIITKGLEALINLGHRGAAGADPETGDGAGILMQMPHEFFAKQAASLGIDLPDVGSYGVGTIFLPQDPDARTRCIRIVERTVRDEGCRLLGWRDVPTNPDAIGVLSRGVMPVIRQFFVDRPTDENPPSPSFHSPPPSFPRTRESTPFELRLYVLRRRIENRARDEGLDPYIPCLSSNKVIYKASSSPASLSASTSTSPTRTSRPASRWCIRASAQTRSERGGSRTPTATSSTTARSTPCAATSTG